jgi:protein-S-isoprenylcysteine O-methyltransferase Ste14
MIPLQGFIILVLYIILGIFFFGVLFKVKLNKRELFGRPTLNVYYQMAGKLSLFIPILTLPAQILGMRFHWMEPDELQQWIAVLLATLAMTFLVFSLLQMGKYTKMGLPQKDKIILQTTGIYAISRNPMYFGLALLALASLLFVPNPVSLIGGIIGVWVHHSIIIQEENYLKGAFDDKWANYTTRVRRYI